MKSILLTCAFMAIAASAMAASFQQQQKADMAAARTTCKTDLAAATTEAQKNAARKACEDSYTAIQTRGLPVSITTPAK